MRGKTLSKVRGGTKLGEGKGSKLGEPCPKVRLSQDRLPILRTNVICANVASSKCHSTNCCGKNGFIVMALWLTKMLANFVKGRKRFIHFIHLTGKMTKITLVS